MNLARDIQIQNQTGYQKVPAIDGQWQGAVKESHRAWDDETAGEQKKKLLRGPARDFFCSKGSPRAISHLETISTWEFLLWTSLD